MKQLLENLIKEWWARPLPEIINREIGLSSYLDLPVRKVISVVGIRRSGKTYNLLTLARKVGQQNTVYINFEDERLPNNNLVLTKFIETLTELTGKRSFVLLMDEIQNVENWAGWTRRIVETTNHQLFISGSSSRLSSSELPTQLRGRSLTVEMRPLNFREFLKFKQVDWQRLPQPDQLHLTREYLGYGGFPEIVLVDEGKKPLILDEYYKTFLTRDIVERHRIRNQETLKGLIKLLLNSPFYTITKLTSSLKSLGLEAGKATVSRYLSHLEESYFLSGLELHTASIKNRLKAPRKPYFVDNYFLSRYSTEFSQNLGRLMENLVFNNLNDVYYWKDYQNREVDFVIREQETVKELIQVNYVLEQGVIPDREIANLVKAAKQNRCMNLTLITWDLKKVITDGQLKIKLVPLTEFLLSS